MVVANWPESACVRWDRVIRDWQDIRSLPHQKVNIQTEIMTLRTASILALVGTLLLTVLAAADFFNITYGYVREIVPAMAVLRSLIYLFGAACVTVFFFMFTKAQGR